MACLCGSEGCNCEKKCICNEPAGTRDQVEQSDVFCKQCKERSLCTQSSKQDVDSEGSSSNTACQTASVENQPGPEIPFNAMEFDSNILGHSPERNDSENDSLNSLDQTLSQADELFLTDETDSPPDKNLEIKRLAEIPSPDFYPHHFFIPSITVSEYGASGSVSVPTPNIPSLSWGNILECKQQPPIAPSASPPSQFTVVEDEPQPGTIYQWSSTLDLRNVSLSGEPIQTTRSISHPSGTGLCSTSKNVQNPDEPTSSQAGHFSIPSITVSEYGASGSVSVPTPNIPSLSWGNILECKQRSPIPLSELLPSQLTVVEDEPRPGTTYEWTSTLDLRNVPSSGESIRTIRFFSDPSSTGLCSTSKNVQNPDEPTSSQAGHFSIPSITVPKYEASGSVSVSTPNIPSSLWGYIPECKQRSPIAPSASPPLQFTVVEDEPQPGTIYEWSSTLDLRNVSSSGEPTQTIRSISHQSGTGLCSTSENVQIPDEPTSSQTAERSNSDMSISPAVEDTSPLEDRSQLLPAAVPIVSSPFLPAFLPLHLLILRCQLHQVLAYLLQIFRHHYRQL